MLKISYLDESLIIFDPATSLAGKYKSQLHFWGFIANAEQQLFKTKPDNAEIILDKLVNYLTRNEIPFELDPGAEDLLERSTTARNELIEALETGNSVKEGTLRRRDLIEFVDFLRNNVKRELKQHQLKAALHLLAVKNGANFSVPGSGKTTVVLCVYQKLKELGLVDALFVVGPPSCFGPWKKEFKTVLGRKPSYEILAGGDIDNRTSKYYVSKDALCELYLTSFQTFHNDWQRVGILFRQRGIRIYFVIDEAHYIKQIGGAWAKAVLSICSQATYRCILTGTPFPKSYTDAFNLFDFLWPQSPPINNKDRIKIEQFHNKGRYEDAAKILDSSIGPLFYRVRKPELGLAPQYFNPAILIKMHKHEKYVYDSIVGRIKYLSQQDYFQDLDTLLKLRQGRMMRLRQCLSYVKLMETAITDYDEDILEGNASLVDIIRHYDDLEVPAKIPTILALVDTLRQQGEKVVIWSNFIISLHLIRRSLLQAGHNVQLIYGATPTQHTSVSEELTREEIIEEFTSKKSRLNVLIANPAACAESISLHKTCSNAIYYDLSYNCAQYIQSLNRIHRVGGSEDKPSYYNFLHYEDTIDNDILENVQNKAGRMDAIIDKEYSIYSLDMFSQDEEIEAYDRLFK